MYTNRNVCKMVQRSSPIHWDHNNVSALGYLHLFLSNTYRCNCSTLSLITIAFEILVIRPISIGGPSINLISCVWILVLWSCSRILGILPVVIIVVIFLGRWVIIRISHWRLSCNLRRRVRQWSDSILLRNAPSDAASNGTQRCANGGTRSGTHGSNWLGRGRHGVIIWCSLRGRGRGSIAAGLGTGWEAFCWTSPWTRRWNDGTRRRRREWRRTAGYVASWKTLVWFVTG